MPTPTNEMKTSAHTAHTPGPWLTDRLCAIIGDGYTLAQVYDHVEMPAFQSEANARLMAAAPALLEALERIAEAEGKFSRDPLTHAENCIENMQAIARAAISQARGGQ